MLFLALIPFYLIGVFPSGYLVSKFYKTDITKEGSGNIGATNVARTLGKKAGAITLALDVFKALLAVYLAKLISNIDAFIFFSGLAVVAGHCFSIPKFLKGGKGVASGLGVLIALVPKISLIVLIVFFLVLTFTKYVSLSSIIATGMAPLLSMSFNYDSKLSLSLSLIAFIILFRHKENIQRLVRGEEGKFAFAKK